MCQGMRTASSFMSKEVKDFAKLYKIKCCNKTLIKLIKKKIEDNPRRWHEVLSKALWAHHISRYGATKITPFELVYAQETVLPVEVNLDACRLAK